MRNAFDGHWRIDASASLVWDYQAQHYAPDEVGEELIRIRVEGDVQDYEVLLGDRPTIRMGYTSRFDDTDWVPYTVREIIGVGAEDAAREVGEFVQRIKSRITNYTVGAVYGLVRTVYVDERTHYRMSKSAAGVAEYSMLRRLAQDGQSYVATVLGVDGVITRVRRFVRTGDSGEHAPTTDRSSRT